MTQFMTRRWLVVSAALVAVAVATVAAVLVTSAQGGGNEARSAELVPADAPLFVTLNTDLTSDEWIAAFRLVERLGIEDPEQELRDSFDDEAGDVNWEQDVAPLLGGDIGVFVRSADVAREQFDGAVIARPSDLTAARELFEREVDAALTPGEYEGVAYEAGDGTALAEIGEFFVIASSEEILRDVIDVHRGVTPSLADADAFKELLRELPDEFLTLMFVDGNDMLTMLATSEPTLAALVGPGAVPGTPAYTAVVVSADGDAFTLRSASQAAGTDDASPNLLEPFDSELAERLPAGTAVFAVMSGLAQAFEAGASSEEADQAAKQAGFPDSAALFAELRALTGIDIEGLVTQLTGEIAGGVWWTGTDVASPEFAVLAEVEDETATRDLIEDLIEQVLGIGLVAFETEEAGGAELYLLPPQDGLVIGFGLDQGVLAVGTREALRFAFDPTGESLADAAPYGSALSSLNGDASWHLYMDIPALVGVATANVDDPAVGTALQAMRSLIVNASQGDDLSLFEALLQIPGN